MTLTMLALAVGCGLIAAWFTHLISSPPHVALPTPKKKKPWAGSQVEGEEEVSDNGHIIFIGLEPPSLLNQKQSRLFDLQQRLEVCIMHHPRALDEIEELIRQANTSPNCCARYKIKFERQLATTLVVSSSKQRIREMLGGLGGLLVRVTTDWHSLEPAFYAAGRIDLMEMSGAMHTDTLAN